MVGAEPRSRWTARRFFNPPDPGVTSGEFEYVQDTLVLGTGERVRLADENN